MGCGSSSTDKPQQIEQNIDHLSIGIKESQSNKMSTLNLKTPHSIGEGDVTNDPLNNFTAKAELASSINQSKFLEAENYKLSPSENLKSKTVEVKIQLHKLKNEAATLDQMIENLALLQKNILNTNVFEASLTELKNPDKIETTDDLKLIFDDLAEIDTNTISLSERFKSVSVKVKSLINQKVQLSKRKSSPINSTSPSKNQNSRIAFKGKSQDIQFSDKLEKVVAENLRELSEYEEPLINDMSISNILLGNLDTPKAEKNDEDKTTQEMTPDVHEKETSSQNTSFKSLSDLKGSDASISNKLLKVITKQPIKSNVKSNLSITVPSDLQGKKQPSVTPNSNLSKRAEKTPRSEHPASKLPVFISPVIKDIKKRFEDEKPKSQLGKPSTPGPQNRQRPSLDQKTINLFNPMKSKLEIAVEAQKSPSKISRPGSSVDPQNNRRLSNSFNN